MCTCPDQKEPHVHQVQHDESVRYHCTVHGIDYVGPMGSLCPKCSAKPDPKSTCACGEADCDGESGMIGKPDETVRKCSHEIIGMSSKCCKCGFVFVDKPDPIEEVWRKWNGIYIMPDKNEHVCLSECWQAICEEMKARGTV